MFNKKITVTAAVIALAAGAYGAYNLPISDFIMNANAEEDGDGWYHELEAKNWVADGGTASVIDDVLTNISTATGQRSDPDKPDTIIDYGPGNWIYEWSEVGKKALKNAQLSSEPAQKMALAKEALTYFSLASHPHLSTPHALAAMEQARSAYFIIADQLDANIEPVDIVLDGSTFRAYAHKPKGEGPFPVVIISNGSDQSKEGLLGYFIEYLLPMGVAMISLDLPGMGDSREFNLQEVETDTLHLAAIDYAKQQPIFDSNNIFLQGSSFGGNSVARAFLRPDGPDIAGFIFNCAVLDQPFLVPADAYDSIEKFRIDGVKTRFNLNIDDSNSIMAEHLRGVALSKGGLFDGPPISKPLLAFNANKDPVSPMEDFEKLVKRATNVTQIVIDKEDHCVEDAIEAPVAANWLKKHIEANLNISHNSQL